MVFMVSINGHPTLMINIVMIINIILIYWLLMIIDG